MSTEITNQVTQLPAELAAFFSPEEDRLDLKEGVTPGYGVVSLRGRVFRIKHKDVERAILDTNRLPVTALDLVIVGASRNLSRAYYSKGYVEGSIDPPDCASLHGIKPDVGVANPQNPTCQGCPQNEFGSKVTDAGKSVKACGTARRLAVLPLHDLVNEQFGGPMLLRVPYTGLAGLASYGDELARKNTSYKAVGTQVRFDTSVSYPLPVFNVIRVLSVAELRQVAVHLQSGAIEHILSTHEDLPTVAEGAPDTPAQAVQPQPVAEAVQPAVAPAQAQPAPIWGAAAPSEAKPELQGPVWSDGGAGQVSGAPEKPAKTTAKKDGGRRRGRPPKKAQPVEEQVAEAPATPAGEMPAWVAEDVPPEPRAPVAQRGGPPSQEFDDATANILSNIAKIDTLQDS